MDALAPNEVGQQPLRAGCCAPDALTVAAPERLNVKPCYLGAEVEVGTKAGPIHPSGGQPYWPFESLALRQHQMANWRDGRCSGQFSLGFREFCRRHANLGDSTNRQIGSPKPV